MRLILASKSPRRRQLLAQLDMPVEVVSIDVDEHLDATVSALEAAEKIACRKADTFPIEILKDDEVLVTADTVVILENEILGKPHGHDDAVAMLRRLSSREHQVRTGVCLRSRQQKVSFTEETTVHFHPLSDAEINHYVDTYQPYDKAGAYGIQEWIGLIGVERIEGCFYNVMGLPVARLYRELTNKFLSR